jgi:hypothetical protein
MKSKKNKHKTAEIPKAFQDTLIELAESLLPYYKVEIPLWDQEEYKVLEGYTPSDAEIQNFPLQMQPTYLTLKWTAFHPASWFFSQETMLNAIHNPMFYTIDYVFQTLLPGRDLKGILETLKKPSARIHKEMTGRHKLAVTGFRGLFFLSQKYFEKLNREAYGRKIFDHFSKSGQLKSGDHPLTIIAEWVHQANRNVASAVDSTDNIYGDELHSRDSFAIILESIWRFIQRRSAQANSLKEYVPPQLKPGPVKDFHLKIINLIEQKDREIMFMQKDAVAGIFRVLNREGYNRLVDYLRVLKPTLPPRDITDEFIREFGFSGEILPETDWGENENLDELNKFLTPRQNAIKNAYLKAYGQDLKPTQSRISREVGIDIKTLRKELKNIKTTYLKNKPQ